MTTLSELAGNVDEEKLSWDRARLQLEEARSNYEYAERKLILARDSFFVEFHAEPDPIGAEGVLSKELWDAISSIAFLAMPIGQACRQTLESWGAATTEEIADWLQAGGFEFKSNVPVREVHAALLKQPWAKKNKKTGQWEYQEYFKSWHPSEERRSDEE